MNYFVQSELEKLAKQWRDGTPVRVLAIGHRSKPKLDAQGHPTGEHQQIKFDHHRAFELVFKLVEAGLSQDHDFSWPEFHELAHAFGQECQATLDEFEAAASFAWVVMHRGWARSLEGHHEKDLVTISRRAQA